LDWITFIKNDENKALEKLYKDYRDPCINWLKSNFNLDREDSLEIFQLSVVILYDNIQTKKLTHLSSDIKSYLFSIARNKTRELHRKYSREIRKGEFTGAFKSLISEDQGEEKRAFEERLELVYKGLQSLGDPCKTLLQLYYYKRLSMSDICELMGYKNTDTTKNLKYKCIKRLQSILITHKETRGTIG